MKLRRTISISLICSLIIFLLNFFGVFTYLELKTYDYRIVKTAKHFSPNDSVYVVLLDQDSLDWGKETMNWSWPWPRSAYADLVNFFSKGKAASVTFDVVFSEPSVYGNADDEKFAQASKDFGKVVQVQYLDSNMETGDGFVNPIPQLKNSAKLLGNINSIPDNDSIIRRSRLFFNFDDKEIPTLGVATLLASEKTLPTIKTDKDGSVLLRFKEGLYSYIPYSVKDILQSYYDLNDGKESVFLPEDFKDAHIFFGFYAAGLFDICVSPLSSSYPGVGIHITLLDNILNNEFIHKASLIVEVIFILLLSFLGAFILDITEKQNSTYKSILWDIALLAIVIILYLITSYILFIHSIWIPIVAILASFIFSFLVSFFVSYNSERKQKRYLKSAFKQYLSPSVIEELISHPERLKLGGERKEISIYFSDIQGFTSVSEKLSPEKLTDLLNTYLSAMSNIILSHGGTIDKYEGDAIIAFWNAPIAQPNHAKLALEAAIECQKVLENMNPQLQEKNGGIPMKMRIGLNTGFAVVGNMGSDNRFDYTMLGDSVNLASRLEGINKQFGSYTMCTKTAMEKAIEQGTELSFVEIAKVLVVGKSEPVTIFEPMAKTDFENNKEMFSTFSDGLQLFYKGNLAQAIEKFQTISNRYKPAEKYIDKCNQLINSVDASWKGLWVATEK